MSARRRVSFAVALLVLATAGAAHAARKWQFLGERLVTDRLDHDVIAVTAYEGNFTALQVRVKGRAVQFRSMTVHFGNGTRQEVELREVVAPGGASRVIDLEGGDRVIQRVEFVYDAQAIRGRQALVRLFGRR
ncbi:MAG TPA: hypothetical protein VI942_10740 [Thermoanaerobaculia bacterium]|nr:hypothetical protein [Thermoanaerobaculia bacterium]